MELVNDFHDTAEKVNALQGGLEPDIIKMSDQIQKTIENGSAAGGSATTTLVQVQGDIKSQAPARNIKRSKKLNQMSS